MWVDILLLSHLARYPCHSYELRRRVEADTGMALHNNSLYPALRRFSEAGAVTKTAEPQQGRPARLKYELTEVGRELLHDLLADLPAELAADPREFLARVGGFSQLDPDEQRGVLDARRAALTAQQERFTALAAMTAPDRWARLVFEELQRRHDDEQRWLDRLAKHTVEH